MAGRSPATPWCNCADGIYVDGGTHITISRNTVQSSDIGVEVAAENPKGVADHITVEHNVITGSLYVGLSVGGYCNGAQDCGGVLTGAAHDNAFEYNYLRGNNQLDDGSPELLIQYHAYRNTFEHNTIVATDSAHAVYGTVPDDEGVAGEPGNRSDHNYFAAVGAIPSTLQFGWRSKSYDSPAAYLRASGQDAHSRFG